MQRDNARGLLTRPFRAANSFGRKTEAIDAPARRQRRGRPLAFLASLALVVGVLGAAAIPASAAFTFQNDEQGANDQPNQKDLTRHGVDATGLPTSIDVTWNWDDIGLSGANTGDACSLFDTDLDAKVNFAVCVTIEGTPAVQASVSPRLYTCGDDKVDRCTQPVTQIPSFSTTCTVSQTATDPFGPLAPNGPGDAFPLDTTANCHVIMSDVGGTSAKLINTCSYPSEEPNSDPSDCVLIIRDGFLVIDKIASPDDSSALFDFTLDSGSTPVFTAHGSETSSVIAVRTDITHSLAEAAPTGWQLDSASCAKGNGTTGTKSGNSISGIDVDSDETVTCTFNNSLQTGKLEVKKDLNPTSDPGRFNLLIKQGTTTIETEPNAGDGGSTGENTVNTGTYQVSETAGTTPATSLANYQKSIECKDQNGTGSVVASVAADSAGPLDVTVGAGDDIVCTITNTRETGKLEVKKDLNPTSDPGRFNLLIKQGATTVDSEPNAGDGGSTGENPVNTGTYQVSETAGTTPATSLANYQKSIECKDQNGTGSVVASVAADSAGPLDVTVGNGDDIVCTITNTREQGKLELKKDLEPDADPGRFNLLIKQGTTTVDSEPNAGDGGSTGENPVNTGTYQVSETAGTNPVTSLDDYQKSIKCIDTANSDEVVLDTGTDEGGPKDVTVDYGDDIVCTITNTRETGKLEVTKSLDPSSDPGKFNLQIDGSTDPDAQNVGDGGSTGEETVNTGTHSVGEAAGTNTSLDDYQKSIKCIDTANADAVVLDTGTDEGGPKDVTVDYGDDIVCTLTNTRETGAIEVKKDLNPSTDSGRFNLLIKQGTTTIDSEPNAGDGGSTGENPVNTGTYQVSETAGTSPATSLANYQKSIECKDQNGTGSVVASVAADSAGPLDVTVGYGDDIVCTIANTRETGKLEVKKDLEPNSDPGRFNLLIKQGTTTVDSEPNAGDGGSTGEKTVNTGTYRVSETAGTSPATSLANYQKSIECKDQDGAGSVVASVGPDSAGPLNVNVTTGSDIVCTITNTRETGKLEVKKDLEPNSDPGRFNLLIKQGTTTVDSEPNAGDGGSTGENTVNTGTYKVSETAGTTPATSLANYQKSIECKDQDGSGSVVASVGPDSAGPLNVNVTTGSDIVCTITNVREQGTIELRKDLEPDSDPGRFNLLIKQGTTTVDSEPNAGDGGSTGENTVNTGTYKVSETAGTTPATSLANYQKSIECKDQDGAGSVVASVGPDSAGPLNVTVGNGDDIVCTITNTRETGAIELKKDLNPSTDSGRFNLLIKQGTTTIDSEPNAGDGGSTGENTVNTGTYQVSEAAGTSPATSLANYQKSIECKDQDGAGSVVASVGPDSAGPLNVSVANGDDIVCTITNVRETGTIEVIKKLEPTTDDGLFNLQVDGVTHKTDATDGDTTGPVTVNTGTGHSVGETAGTNTFLSHYTSAISCTRNGQQLKSGSGTALGGIALDKDDAIVCTITNTRKPLVNPLTPGYWKNHEGATTRLLPIDLGDYTVDTFSKATAVFINMNCGSSQPNAAIGCLAGHLLASKLNVKHNADSCIQPVIDKADAFLRGESVTYAGITATGVDYTGPGTYTLTADQRSLAIALKDALDKYNNGGGCT